MTRRAGGGVNTTRTLALLAALTLTAGAAACSSSSAGAGRASPAGGVGGVTPDASGAGGSAGVGAGGLGGAGATGGGTGGTGGLPPCEPPEDPARAAICIALDPEPLTPEVDPDFDLTGDLVVEAFDRPDPTNPDGTALTPIAAFTNPGPVRLHEPVPMIRLDDLPSTIYLRLVFRDGPSASLAPGVWLGGHEAAELLAPRPRLRAQNLSLGTGKSVSVPLVAVRELTVEVSIDGALVAADDGEGPTVFRAYADPAGDVMVGRGASPCLAPRVDGAIRGLVIGGGNRFLEVVLDDFGLGVGAGTPPGALHASADGGTRRRAFSVPQAAYRHRVPLVLDGVQPTVDGGSPRPFPCTPPDGGASDAGDAATDADVRGDAAADAPADTASESSGTPPDGPTG